VRKLIKVGDLKVLKDYGFRSEYNTGANNPIFEFLMPALERSKTYDRAVGFFSSGILSVIPQAFSTFAEKGGRIRLVCSPVLSPDDADTLLKFKNHEESIRDLSLQIDSFDQPSILKEPLDLFVALIRNRVLELKFAIPYSQVGIHHQKMGVFVDENRSALSFHGSNNESLFGWLQGLNYEEFLVFRDWHDGSEAERVRKAMLSFEALWNDETPGVDVIDALDALNFIEKRKEIDLDFDIVKDRVKAWVQDWHPTNHSKTELRSYQKEVLSDWELRGNTGIISFATGVGKTKTALEAIKRWVTKPNKSVLIIVPDVRLKDQWLAEISTSQIFTHETILEVGGGANREIWLNLLGSYTSSPPLEGERIVIAVQDTANTEAFITRVNWSKDLLVIADEVHRLGEPSSKNLLQRIKGLCNLGLSATPDRFLDPIGTERIREVFGDDLQPAIDIARAISMEVLVPYVYKFCTVTLTESEEDQYIRITKQITIAKSNAKTEDDHKKVRDLEVVRARIIKKAERKIPIISEIIRSEFAQNQHWLLYCEDTEQVIAFRNALKDLRPLTYFQNSDGSHSETLRNFSQGEGGLIIAVQMLDEGVDIPALDHAFLIASSKNPRQYVQRRGRVLRRSSSKIKHVAHIWDVFAVGQDGKAIDKYEVNRGITFAKDAFNKSIISSLSQISHDLSDIKVLE
jgi:superfamily II DNA or RNA helicase